MSDIPEIKQHMVKLQYEMDKYQTMFNLSNRLTNTLLMNLMGIVSCDNTEDKMKILQSANDAVTSVSKALQLLRKK